MSSLLHLAALRSRTRKLYTVELERRRNLEIRSDFSIPTEQLDTYQFAQAYDKLIRQVRERYPSALVLCILGDRYFDGMKTSGAAATAIVHEICTHYGVPYAEVNFGDQRSTCRYQNGSNVHPTPEGMSFMADAVWQVLEKLL